MFNLKLIHFLKWSHLLYFWSVHSYEFYLFMQIYQNFMRKTIIVEGFLQ